MNKLLKMLRNKRLTIKANLIKKKKKQEIIEKVEEEGQTNI